MEAVVGFVLFQIGFDLQFKQIKNIIIKKCFVYINLQSIIEYNKFSISSMTNHSLSHQSVQNWLLHEKFH